MPHSEKELVLSTPRHQLKAVCDYGFARMDDVVTRRAEFFSLCKEGCPNFNKKWSCPPCSPDFSIFKRRSDEMLVVLFKLDLHQLDGTGYPGHHKVRLGNAVLKPRAERLMRGLERIVKGRYFSTGACRLCKPCQKKLGRRCRHPDRMRYSLEACGVDCDALSRKVFGVPLQWYRDKRCPDYTSVICALPVPKGVDKAHLLCCVESELLALTFRDQAAR